MSHERVMRPWLLSPPDEDGDINVTAAPNVTVSIFRTFVELKELTIVQWEMLTSDDEIRDYLRRRLRNNTTKSALGGASFWVKSGHNLFERDPYDKRLVKAIIIQLLGGENEPACERCQDGKGPFFGCRSIKSWGYGCCANCKKFDACVQCSVSDGFKQEQREAEKALKDCPQPVSTTTRSGRATKAPAKYSS